MVWSTSYGAGFGGLATLVAVLFLAFQLFLTWVCWKDATLRREAGLPVAFVPPWAWAATTFLFGLLGLAFYWFAHYSNLVAGFPLVGRHTGAASDGPTGPGPWDEPGS